MATYVRRLLAGTRRLPLVGHGAVRREARRLAAGLSLEWEDELVAART